MQWLRTLGTCLHDHNALTMEFRWKRKQVRLMGESRTNPSPVTFAQMRTILEAVILEASFILLPLRPLLSPHNQTTTPTFLLSMPTYQLTRKAYYYDIIRFSPHHLNYHRTEAVITEFICKMDPRRLMYDPTITPLFRKMPWRSWFKKCLTVAIFVPVIVLILRQCS